MQGMLWTKNFVKGTIHPLKNQHLDFEFFIEIDKDHDEPIYGLYMSNDLISFFMSLAAAKVVARMIEFG